MLQGSEDVSVFRNSGGTESEFVARGETYLQVCETTVAIDVEVMSGYNESGPAITQ